MSEHLPECQRAYRDHLHRCICKYVLRCEQRMREEHRHRCSGCDWCYSDGVREALDSAREAVAALDIGRDVRFSVDVQADALAAIDALREEKP